MNSPIILKPRDIPREMLQTEALSRRLAPRHFKKNDVDQDAKNLRAGYNGEKSLDFTLNFLGGSYHILHNLRIRDINDFFQMDTLIPSIKFILISEVKNIAGTVIYDEFGQTIRISKNGEEKNLGNHMEQVNLQHLRLQRFIREHNFPAIPIEKLIVYSDPKTIIKNITNNKFIRDTVIHKEQFLTKLNEFAAIHKTASVTLKQLELLSATLIKAHTPKEIDIMEKYRASIEDLLLGVFCPKCGALPMQWMNAKWNCNQCGAASKTAHIPALKDYSLLFGNMINNRQAREFLKLGNIHTAKRILIQFKQVGNTSARKYILHF
ncbi:nuclease-related domain-containing protein [Virgibacillus doumboii]|uniref:nuclease-related domain-containing protein n=1 Tax=Virgibacillus doumboii TaxID=2697503 RepID=UPI0013DFC823|nr:nuclease-related domain-containing protein [Virgibacillus doumboii]